MFCVHCGKQLREGTVFCPGCGMKQATAQSGTTDISSSPAASTTTVQLSAKTKKIAAVIAAMAVVLIIILAAVHSGNGLTGTWQSGLGQTMEFKDNGTVILSQGGSTVTTKVRYTKSRNILTFYDSNNGSNPVKLVFTINHDTLKVTGYQTGKNTVSDYKDSTWMQFQKTKKQSS
ncbi:MAG: zinc ribbon domain-containing protein [Ethanoligenens sp.]